jgi:hypothetical protein
LRVARRSAAVDDEAVQPGRELRLAPELLEPDADLRERLLGGVARVVGIAQEVAGEPLDLRRVPSTERLERLTVAVLGPGDEDRVAELLVRDAAVAPERLGDRAGS